MLVLLAEKSYVLVINCTVNEVKGLSKRDNQSYADQRVNERKRYKIMSYRWTNVGLICIRLQNGGLVSVVALTQTNETVFMILGTLDNTIKYTIKQHRDCIKVNPMILMFS